MTKQSGFLGWGTRMWKGRLTKEYEKTSGDNRYAHKDKIFSSFSVGLLDARQEL